MPINSIVGFRDEDRLKWDGGKCKGCKTPNARIDVKNVFVAFQMCGFLVRIFLPEVFTLPVKI